MYGQAIRGRAIVCVLIVTSIFITLSRHRLLPSQPIRGQDYQNGPIGNEYFSEHIELYTHNNHGAV